PSATVYYLDVKNAKDYRLHRADAATRKVTQSASFTDRAVGLCVASDGKAVFLTLLKRFTPATKRTGSGRVVSLDPVTLKEQGSADLTFFPYDVAAGPDGLVYVFRYTAARPSIVALDPAKSFAQLADREVGRGRLALQMGPSGKRLYAAA